VLVWLSVWSEVQIVCMWSTWCHCHPKTLSCLVLFKSRLFFFFFRYWLTQVVLEERQLNECSCLFLTFCLHVYSVVGLLVTPLLHIYSWGSVWKNLWKSLSIWWSYNGIFFDSVTSASGLFLYFAWYVLAWTKPGFSSVISYGCSFGLTGYIIIKSH